MTGRRDLSGAAARYRYATDHFGQVSWSAWQTLSEGVRLEKREGVTEFEFCMSSAAEQSPKVGGGHCAASHDCQDDGVEPR